MIKFPGLNIEFTIEKIALSIGGIDIYWYAIIIVFAIIISMIILKTNQNKCNIQFNTMTDLAIYLIPISIIGARLYYVIFNLGISITARVV